LYFSDQDFTRFRFLDGSDLAKSSLLDISNCSHLLITSVSFLLVSFGSFLNQSIFNFEENISADSLLPFLLANGTISALVTVHTGDKVNTCCVCVAFACKRVALLSTACERVCLDVLTHTFVLYHNSTYLFSNYILFAGVDLHGLQTSKMGHSQKAMT